MADFMQKITVDLLALGVRPGGVLLVHSSLKSLGGVPGGQETIIQGLCKYLGEDGTLLMPALTYASVRPDRPVFDVRRSPSCVGAIPEYFRLRPGTQRSFHPTHSVCGVGRMADALLAPHGKDSTPCGPNSPFHRLPECGGQILMLGCGLRPNTSMHAIEELVVPPYLFNPPIIYTLTDENGDTIQKQYTPHNFSSWKQRYDRVAEILAYPHLRVGKVLEAQSHLIEARGLKEAALKVLKENPLFFVDRAESK
jgi:aminoglycoside 3-N-acetyltransferase